MGGIINNPKMASIIKPAYVWLTTASAVWTNAKGAETLAKRKAGIAEFVIVPVANVENTPFKIVNKKEFLPKIEKSPYVYMYGVILPGVIGSMSYGDISALTTNKWGGISYATSVSKQRIDPYSRKMVMSEFESLTNEQAPLPVTKTVASEKMTSNTYSCMVVAAMIVGESGDD